MIPAPWRQNALLALLIGMNLLGLLNVGRQLHLYCLNSDSLYLTCVYRDLCKDGFGLAGWTLSPAPCFFPDMALYFPLLSICPDLGLGLALYGVVFFAVLLPLLFGMAVSVQPDRRRAAAAVLLGNLLFLSLVQTFRGLGVAECIFVPGRHAGSLLTGAALVVLALVILRRGLDRGVGLLFSVLTFAAVLSDIVIVPQFLGPILAAYLILWASGEVTGRPVLRLAGLALGAGILGRAALGVLPYCNIITPPPSYSAVYSVLDSLRQFVHDIDAYLGKKPLFALLILGWLLGTAFVLRSRKASGVESSAIDRSLLFLLLFFLFSMAGTAAAPVLGGLWISQSETRYVIPLFTVPCWTLSFLLAAYWESIPRQVRIAAFTAVLVFAGWRILPGLSEFQYRHFVFPYPDSVRFLDETAQKHNLEFGYGDYWSANYFTTLSRKRLRVNALNRFLPYFWINNRNAYWKRSPSDARYPVYEFFVTRKLPREEILRRFGEPAAVETNGEIEILIYNRPEDIAFRQCLRPFFLAQEEGTEHLGQHRPLKPTWLARYKPPGSPGNARGNSVMKDGEKAVLQFAPGSKFNTIEICADAEDEYEVAFFENEAALKANAPYSETVKVPAANGENMQIRYLPLPPTLHEKPIEYLTVTPTAGDGEYSVGHVFWYDDHNGNFEF